MLASDEAFADIICSGHDDPTLIYAAVIGNRHAPAAVLEYGSEANVRGALEGAGVAGASERAYAAWWLANEYAEGRIRFADETESGNETVV